jgi:hypothetical protein
MTYPLPAFRFRSINTDEGARFVMNKPNSFVEMPSIQPVPVSLEIRFWRRKPGKEYDPSVAAEDLKIASVGALLIVMALWVALG